MWWPTSPPHGLADHIREGDLATISTPIDLLGVNYYSSQAVSYQPAPRPLGGDAPVKRATRSPFPAADGVHNHARDLPVTGIGWEVDPSAFTRLLVRVHEDYTGPSGIALYVTENGAACPDQPDEGGFVRDHARLDYFDQHLRAAHEAIEQGVDLRGYFAWSFMDNFEWAWGYSQRFGMVHVDYQTQQRTPKASALWYADVARSNSVPPSPLAR